jgi:K+ transporter
MKNKLIIAAGLLTGGSLFAQDAVATPDVSTVMSETINNANTVLTAVIAIGGVILAWKLLRKFFSKTG